LQAAPKPPTLPASATSPASASASPPPTGAQTSNPPTSAGTRSKRFAPAVACSEIPEGGFVYYTHSWRSPVIPATAATTPYGGPFTAAVERDNVMGAQFHPEKSSTIGLQLLKNFVNL